jgi:hypothetical protein
LTYVTGSGHEGAEKRVFAPSPESFFLASRPEPEPEDASKRGAVHDVRDLLERRFGFGFSSRPFFAFLRVP